MRPRSLCDPRDRSAAQQRHDRAWVDPPRRDKLIVRGAWGRRRPIGCACARDCRRRIESWSTRGLRRNAPSGPALRRPDVLNPGGQRGAFSVRGRRRDRAPLEPGEDDRDDGRLDALGPRVRVVVPGGHHPALHGVGLPSADAESLAGFQQPSSDEALVNNPASCEVTLRDS